MKNQIRMAVIGAGKITPYHLECARNQDFLISAICGRHYSVNAKKLAHIFEIPFVGESVEQMLDLDVDCYLLTSSTNSQIELLKLLIPTNRFILVEKPVATQDLHFESIIKNFDTGKVVVGYNRRYYSSVQDLKKISDNTKPLNFMMNLPESSWNATPTSADIEYLILENSVHMFDLIFYLFGKPSDIKFFGLNKSEKLFSRLILLDYKNKEIHGVVNLSLGVPDNYSLSVTSSGIKCQLLPIETLRIFDGIEMNSASASSPNKKYVPVSTTNWDPKPYDVAFKAGFYEQLQDFRSLIETSNRTERQATLEDARYVMDFARRVLVS